MKLRSPGSSTDVSGPVNGNPTGSLSDLHIDDADSPSKFTETITNEDDRTKETSNEIYQSINDQLHQIRAINQSIASNLIKQSSEVIVI